MSARWEHPFGLVGLVMLAVGSYIGLFAAPPERWMGDVMRIMYVHVPAAWASLLCFLVSFIAAVAWLWSRRWGWDALLEATMEVGVVLGALLLALGSIWAKPTWGVWWDWDPRLTSMAVLEIGFLGIIALRGFVDEPEQRARWSAVAAIFASVNVPIVYFSVKWWKTLHQPFSTAETVSSSMRQPLYINAVAFILIGVWLVARRWRIARIAQEAELAGPDGLPVGGAA